MAVSDRQLPQEDGALACERIEHIPAECLNLATVNRNLQINHSFTDHFRSIAKVYHDSDSFHRSELKRFLPGFVFGVRHYARSPFMPLWWVTGPGPFRYFCVAVAAAKYFHTVASDSPVCYPLQPLVCQQRMPICIFISRTPSGALSLHLISEVRK